jgi:hypothetical protein
MPNAARYFTMKSCDQHHTVHPLLFPLIPKLFFRSLGTGSVDDGTRTGRWRRENGKQFQVAVTNVS